jgi:putative membrane protein
MPSDALLAGDRSRRLHPASPAFSLASLARQYLVPFVLFVLFARGDTWQRWLVVPFAGALAFELVRYFTLTYRLTAHELVIRSGLLSRTERHIPYERIQNIELVENAVHRLLGVAEVRLQTGGGREVEAHLRVVSRSAVDEIRAALVAAKPGAGAQPAAAPSVLLRLPLREIALHGLLTGRAFVLLAAIGGVLFEYNVDWQPVLGWILPAEVTGAIAQGGPRWARGEAARTAFSLQRALYSLLLWTAVFAAVLILLRLAAAAWTLVRLYDFTLERTGDGLQSRYGLFTRLSATIPRARVQVLTVTEGFVLRRLGRASVSVETAGEFSREQGRLGSQWVAPIVAAADLDTLVREVQPDAVLDPPEWTPVHRRAFTRIARLQVAWMVLAAAAASVPLGPIVAVPALIGIALSVWHARLLAGRLAIALTPTSVVLRTGAFGHRRSIARFARIQSVTCERSPFDRRWGMASLTVDTAGGSDEHRIAMPYLDEPVARAIYQRLRAEVARAVRA